MMYDVHCKDRQFCTGDSVFVKNFGRGLEWLPGVVDLIKGPVTYVVKLTDGRVVKRHVDHIRIRTSEQSSVTHDDLSFGPTNDETPLEQQQRNHEQHAIPLRTSTRARRLPSRYLPDSHT